MKKISKKILFLILSGIVFFPVLACGQTLQSITQAAATTALTAASGVVVVCWVITGILFLSATGDPSKLSSAKTALIVSVIGTVILIIANTNALGFVKNIFNL